MSMKEIQISAVVSADTKALLDRLVRSTGLKKGYVVEMALRHRLRTLAALPSEFIIPPRLVVSEQTGKEIARRLRSPKKPSKELRDLMSGDGD